MIFPIYFTIKQRKMLEIMNELILFNYILIIISNRCISLKAKLGFDKIFEFMKNIPNTNLILVVNDLVHKIS